MKTSNRYPYLMAYVLLAVIVFFLSLLLSWLFSQLFFPKLLPVYRVLISLIVAVVSLRFRKQFIDFIDKKVSPLIRGKRQVEIQAVEEVRSVDDDMHNNTGRTQPAAEDRLVDVGIQPRVFIDLATNLLVLIRREEDLTLNEILQLNNEYVVSPDSVHTKLVSIVFQKGEEGDLSRTDITIFVKSPDFFPAEQSRKIFVYQDKSTDVLDFLLTPKKVGTLLINVEIYQDEVTLATKQVVTRCVVSNDKPNTQPYRVITIPIIVVANSINLSSNTTKGNISTSGGSYIEGKVETGRDFVGRDHVSQQSGSLNVMGNHSTFNINPVVDPAQRDQELRKIKSWRDSYLNSLFVACDSLSLAGIDPEAAKESQSNLDLSAVYTALITENTQKAEDAEVTVRGEIVRQATHPFSALEMLNKYDHLVLLGNPGSGKSTFVSFVTLCMAGELLNDPKKPVNLEVLKRPVPREAQPAGVNNIVENINEPQPWDHGALLPVRIILRDLATRGLPPPGEPVSVNDLFNFLKGELKDLRLEVFFPYFEEELRLKGGLVMFDGLDEAPEAENEKRRSQIKDVVEKFATLFPNCRVLVTSRPYAYKNQEWRLKDFTDTTLAPFRIPQINQFIDQWYQNVSRMRGKNADETQGRAALLKKAVAENERLQRLAETPLLLTLMASLHAWRGGSLPEKREALYDDAVDLLLDSWESQHIRHNREGQVENTEPSLVAWLKVNDREKVLALLSRLAFEAHQRQTSQSSGTADISQSVLIDGLMSLSNNPDVKPVRLVEFLRDRAGLLLPRGVGVYTFPHRTFQEYLAARYLTDHDYPDLLADLARADYERWREVTLLAVTKAAGGAKSTVWTLVDALCDQDVSDRPEQAQLWGAHLAGQVLVEIDDLSDVSPRNQRKLDRVRGWLVHIVKRGALPDAERALAGKNLALLGDPRFDPELFHLPCEEVAGLVKIDEGLFYRGSDPEKDPLSQASEWPQHQEDLQTFYHARYPTTVAQFSDFVNASGYKPANPACLRGVSNHPVVWVSWPDALAYCEWLDGALRASPRTPAPLSALLEEGYRVSLAMQAEWEKAARCTQPGIYPWGDQPGSSCANIHDTGIDGTSAVGCFPCGASPYGILDMGGNVWEWTCSKSIDTPNVLISTLRDYRELGARIIMGGSWRLSYAQTRCANASERGLNEFGDDIGFRITLSKFS
jgi:formylglycine-generating enzyme required for sulfatase activity